MKNFIALSALVILAACSSHSDRPSSVVSLGQHGHFADAERACAEFKTSGYRLATTNEALMAAFVDHAGSWRDETSPASVDPETTIFAVWAADLNPKTNAKARAQDLIAYIPGTDKEERVFITVEKYKEMAANKRQGMNHQEAPTTDVLPSTYCTLISQE